MKITVLEEGSYSVAADKKFIPFDEKIHDPKDRPGSLFVHVKPFLVEMKNDLILFDTGLGYVDENQQPIIFQKIKNKGYNPNQITKVLMSHLHFDHSGGMACEVDGSYQINFPNAEYFVQKDELEQALLHPGKSYRKDQLEFIRRSGNLVLMEGSGNINSSISYELTGAHCPFHQVFLLEEEGEKVFFGGDVVPEWIQLVRNYIAKYDYDGRKAMELRKYYGMKASEEEWTCLFYHSKNKEVAKVSYSEEEGLAVQSLV